VKGRHELADGDWFTIGRGEFRLRVLLVARGEEGETTQVGRPPVARTELSPGSTFTGGLKVDPITSVLRSGQNLLADELAAPLERLKGVMHLVDVLLAAGAEAEAGRLLGEALDRLLGRGAPAFMPPLTAARVRAFATRFRMSTGDAAWTARIDALVHAEH
jgi:hypothetical protein